MFGMAKRSAWAVSVTSGVSLTSTSLEVKMVEQIREKISNHRKRIIPGLIALSLLSGLIVSIISTPNAQADYYVGCGYGYNSSGHGFGYGTGIGYGYGYGNNHDGVFQYGYGFQVCKTVATTTTTSPVTTTTAGGGGGGGTTTTTSSTTTTAPVTSTTASTPTTTTPPSKPKRLFANKVHGYAVVGHSVRLAITGGGFYGQPKITSNEPGTKIGVQHDYGNLLIARVTVRARSPKGWHTFTIRDADGKSCRVNYLVK
jgi:hypothetical protein